MKYKHIEAAREIRMWIGQIIVPAIVIAVYINSNPYTKAIVTDKVRSMKTRVKNLFPK